MNNFILPKSLILIKAEDLTQNTRFNPKYQALDTINWVDPVTRKEKGGKPNHTILN